MKKPAELVTKATKDVLAQSYRALVRAHLDYCSLVFLCEEGCFCYGKGAEKVYLTDSWDGGTVTPGGIELVRIIFAGV